MHDNSCWWEVKPLHNNIGIFSKFLNKPHSFIYFVVYVVGHSVNFDLVKVKSKI